MLAHSFHSWAFGTTVLRGACGEAGNTQQNKAAHLLGGGVPRERRGGGGKETLNKIYPYGDLISKPCLL